MAKLQEKRQDVDRPDADPADRTPVRAVRRALDLLALLCEDQSQSLSDLARSSGLPVSTVLRLLNTMEQAGFARREGRSGTFGPGNRLLQAGLSALRRTSLYDLAEAPLRRLAQQSGETANLAVRVDAEHATYLRVAVSPRSVHYAAWLGRVLPRARTAVGQALDGKSGPAGYVCRRDTLERDVTAVAAPVRDASGEIVAALSITGPSFRIRDEDLPHLGQLLRGEAMNLSHALGAGDSAD
ncbi:MAG: hypothetical protein RL322_530 [Pseudomonadota bacterium]|jgi:DNA-binding IclR family transcriptional regulator